MAPEASGASAAPLSQCRSGKQSRAHSRNCQPAVHTQIITPLPFLFVPSALAAVFGLTVFREYISMYE